MNISKGAGVRGQICEALQSGISMRICSDHQKFDSDSEGSGSHGKIFVVPMVTFSLRNVCLETAAESLIAIFNVEHLGQNIFSCSS